MTVLEPMAMIVPSWPAPERVQAYLTTREGGFSAAPWESLNLAAHVGDDAHTVGCNRERLIAKLDGVTRIQWLTQVHGKGVVEAVDDGNAPRADAVWTGAKGVACAVLTADCLPILVCDRDATVVAAVHAGWRGLAAGVIGSTLATLAVEPRRLLAYLGPAICSRCFEVGPEVRECFLAGAGNRLHREAVEGCFQRSAGRPGHYLADLCELARGQLLDFGVGAVYGGKRCTVEQPDRFYSYRRDGRTGRQAALIYLK